MDRQTSSGWRVDLLTCPLLPQQVKVTERYIRRLEFHLSKVPPQPHPRSTIPVPPFLVFDLGWAVCSCP